MRTHGQTDGRTDELMTPPTRQKDFTDFSKFLRIFLKGNVTKIRVSVNQVKIYKFFQDFARILVEKTRTTRIAFKKIFVKRRVFCEKGIKSRRLLALHCLSRTRKAQLFCENTKSTAVHEISFRNDAKI